MKTSDYPKFVWGNSINEQLNLVRTNMTQEDLVKFKKRFTPLILDLPSYDVRKFMLINYLSRKYDIKPTLNPSREHWLKRFVNAYCDGDVKSIEEFVEREKNKEHEKEKE